MIAAQAISTAWIAHGDDDTRDKQFTATLAGMAGFKPADELEGMLAAQAVATHNAAMECYRRAMIEGQTFEGRRDNLAQANKLSRTYAALVEALDKHRGKGQQVVRVEHVTVQAGGQAIVGNIASPGGGAPEKSENQPHAKEQIAYAPGETLPGTVGTQQPTQLSIGG